MVPVPDQLLARLANSPDYYFYAFEGDEAVFVTMDRAAYQRSIFLDHRISPAAEGSIKVPVAELARKLLAAQETNWIFHVAHCGSTLLARALEALGDGSRDEPRDEPGEGLVLREPLALRQLGLAPDRARLELTLALLSRRYPGDGATLIKANVPVNFLLGEIAAADPSARAVFLYCGLQDYLLAILRSANHRAWLRGVTGQLRGHLCELAHLSDAEVGAALWLAQMRRFGAALNRMPNARSLDAEQFFVLPARALAAAAECFAIPASPAEIETVIGGSLFETYSKNPAIEFDNSVRLARRERSMGELAGEIARAQEWVERTAPDVGAVLGGISKAALMGQFECDPRASK